MCYPNKNKPSPPSPPPIASPSIYTYRTSGGFVAPSSEFNQDKSNVANQPSRMFKIFPKKFVFRSASSEGNSNDASSGLNVS